MKKYDLLKPLCLLLMVLYSASNFYGQTYEVGTIPGNLGVSASGAANYTIPIVLPPGRAGMQPSVALAYNSQAAASIMGQGWGLAGFSSITRTNPTIYYNGRNDNIDFIDDELLLDGKHLIKIGVEGGNIIYRTEIDEVSKIIFHTDDALPWFEVKTKNGLTKEYGNSPTSRQVYLEGNEFMPLVWHLNRVYDHQKNMVEYTFIRNKSNGEIHPDKIEYTKEKDKLEKGFYTIDFYYDDINAELQQTAFFEKNGYKYLNRNSMRLNMIIIREADHEDEQIREYQLDYYENKGITKEYYLKSVTLKAKNKTLHPTTFDWDFYQPDYHCSKITSEKDSLWGATPVGHLSMTRVDWNGDLKDEIAVRKTINTKNGPVRTLLSFFSGNFQTSIVLAEADMIVGNLQSADMNMNSNDELIVDLNQGFKIFDIIQVGSGFELPEIYHYTKTGDPNIGDLNGDGIPDCLLTRSDKALLFIGTGSGDQESFIGDDLDEPDPPQLLYESGYRFDGMADFNGDGAADIILINKDSKTIRCYSFDVQNGSFIKYDQFSYAKSERQYYADFNGDGKTDIYLAYEENSATKGKIYFSYGGGFYSTEDMTRTVMGKYLLVADLNNDNRADFLCLKGLTTYHFEFTKPDGLSSTSYQYDDYSGCVQINAACDIIGSTLADLDGNGIRDLVIDFVETYEPPDESPRNRLHMFTFTDKGFGMNAIKSITNGMGVTFCIGYQNISTSGKFFNPGYPLLKFKSPLYLVKETYLENDDEHHLFHKSYSFKNPVFHIHGKGFLGFMQTTVVDDHSNIRMESEFKLHAADIGDKTYYFQLYPYLSKQLYLLEEEDEGQIISLSENDLEIKNTVDELPLIYLPVITKSKTKTWDLDGTFIRSSKQVQRLADIDEFGNSLESKVFIDEGDPISDNEFEFKTTIRNQFSKYYDPEHWLVSRPESSIVEKEISGEKKDFHFKGFVYYDTDESCWPLAKTIVELPNGNKNLQTEIHLEYDRFGNLTKKTLKAPKFEIDGKPYPIEDRIINYEYGDQVNYNSRFLTKKWTGINGSTFLTSFTHDPLSGSVLSKQHPDHLSTSFEYDEFNKLGEIRNPDGSVTYNTVGWAEGHEHTPKDHSAKYYSCSYTIGSAKSTEQEKSLVFYDRFGKVLRSVAFNIDHAAIYIDRLYDTLGRLLKVSEPFFSSQNALQWTAYEYDDLGRIVNTMLPNNNKLSVEYHGRETSTLNQGTSVLNESEVNAIGKVKKITDPTGVIEYGYYSSGNVKQIDALKAKTSLTYNDAGYKETIVEPNSGLTAYVYNPFGEIIRQLDSRGNTYELTYDKLGRLTEKKLTSPDEESTKYIYNDNCPSDEETGEGYGRIKDIIGPNGISYHYTYDELSKLNKQTEVISNGGDFLEYTSLYAYEENMGRLDKLTYPSGFQVGYEYADNGMLVHVSDLTNKKDIWFDPVVNQRGQLTDFELGNGMLTHKGYDSFGFPSEIVTGDVQDLKYGFDPLTGNLNWRADSIFNLIEHFGYGDELKSRLVSSQVANEMEYRILYRDNGNIFRKSDVTTLIEHGGVYEYDFFNKPHAVRKISWPTQQYVNSIPPVQRITYTPFNKVSVISNIDHGDLKEVAFFYGPDDMRKITKEYQSIKGGLDLVRTKYFISGNYEIEVNRSGDERKLHYIYGGDGLCAIYDMSDEGNEMNYIHKDHLGSYQAITDGGGKLVEMLSFDPWGRRRNPETWTFDDVPENYKFDRGFTGHEHLDEFNLINMNGRVYDSWLGRFLSPDPIIQAPGYSQSHNRYSYAFNNPLKYVDPSGYWNGDIPRDTWLKYEGLGMSSAWHRMMQNSMMNQYNNGRFHPGFGGVGSLNRFMASSGYIYLGGGEFADRSGRNLSFDEVFNNYIIPNSNHNELEITATVWSQSKSTGKKFRGFIFDDLSDWYMEDGWDALMSMFGENSIVEELKELFGKYDAAYIADENSALLFPNENFNPVNSIASYIILGNGLWVVGMISRSASVVAGGLIVNINGQKLILKAKAFNYLKNGQAMGIYAINVEAPGAFPRAILFNAADGSTIGWHNTIIKDAPTLKYHIYLKFLQELNEIR